MSAGEFFDIVSGAGQPFVDAFQRNRATNAFGGFLDTLGGQRQPQPQSLSSLGSLVAPSPAKDYASQRVAQAHANGGGDVRTGIIKTAQALGINPVDLATAISYETGGTFDPTKAGPTTQWGQHKGLIQFGEPQAQKYGVDWQNPVGSQLGPEGAIAKYLRDTGVKPGMGLLDIYSAINAGGVGRYDRSDANNGGAPGTVADKVNSQMSGHRQKALALLGGRGAVAPEQNQLESLAIGESMQMPAPGQGTRDQIATTPSAPAQSSIDPQQGGVLPPRDVMLDLFRNAATRPLAIELAKAAQGLSLDNQDPMKQIQYQKAVLELKKLQSGDRSLINAGDGNIYDPTTKEWLRAPGGETKGVPTGYRLKADGSYEAIPGGPADPNNPLNKKKVNDSGGIVVSPDGTVSIGGNQKLTEAQGKDLSLYTQGSDANTSLSKLENQLTDFAQEKSGSLPLGVGNYLRTPEFRQARIAADRFLSAILRKESGAAITDNEFELYGPIFLPVPGDDPATIQSKRRARDVALLGIKAGLGTAEAISHATDQLLGNADQTITPRPGTSSRVGGSASSNKTSKGIDWSVDQ